MQLAKFSMKPLADHLTIPHNHSSDKRIRADSPSPILRKLKRPLQVGSVRACELGIHRTD
jgi:hypothetical protein